ncbi:hypothetical protein L1987_17972 [Smallanthus sonchifolius]|uniref:Uncharacterized protein n=1 Tax=Smallanthus sonchifolius TaxID=185202 RepID=A0ACB9J1X0_9ASTR|nr:hypothetical protein L1987_17972 [Smallanthus sonchifolius]
MSTEMATTDPEGIDGVRMTWNTWPHTKVKASKCVIPIAVSISPIRPHPLIPTNPYAPLRCKTCSAVLNSFCRVDFSTLIWIYVIAMSLSGDEIVRLTEMFKTMDIDGSNHTTLEKLNECLERAGVILKDSEITNRVPPPKSALTSL